MSYLKMFADLDLTEDQKADHNAFTMGENGKYRLKTAYEVAEGWDLKPDEIERLRQMPESIVDHILGCDVCRIQFVHGEPVEVELGHEDEIHEFGSEPEECEHPAWWGNGG